MLGSNQKSQTKQNKSLQWNELEYCEKQEK